MRYVRLALLGLALLAWLGGVAAASTVTLTGPGNLALQIAATAPITKTTAGAAVSGPITVAPAEAVPAGLISIFYLDGQAKFLSALPRPELNLDTSKLKDGLHELRLDVGDGAALTLSTGNIPVHVLNNVTQGLLAQRPSSAAEEASFNKTYRKVVLREIVWFNNREADLEKHAFMSGGRIYITLTDLIRHVGGNIVWGPSSRYIMVERKGVRVQVVPGSARVYVNGEARNLGRPTKQVENRTYVPIRPMLALLNLNTEWNHLQRRAHVALK